jgi:hypothetical protein
LIQEIFDEELKTAAAKLTDEQKEALIQKRLAAEAAKTKGEPMPEAAVRAWFERLFKGSYVPHVIEPSAGLDRMALAVIAKAFSETEKVDEKGKKEVITVLRLHPRVAPIKVGVFPLLKNKPELVAKAREVYALLKKHMNCFYDETASIGRRYARQDEVGTPFGVTIDFLGHVCPVGGGMYLWEDFGEGCETCLGLFILEDFGINAIGICQKERAHEVFVFKRIGLSGDFEKHVQRAHAWHREL